MREAYELLALALANQDENKADDEIVEALTAAAEGRVVRLQSAYASLLYLSRELPADQRLRHLTVLMLRALQHVAEHDPVDGTVEELDWLHPDHDEPIGDGAADRFAN